MVATCNKTMRKHIFLHPVDKRRRYMALKDTLLKDKRKYSDKLKGALLDVGNLKVVGERHLIVDGYISMEVEADCVVFTPQVGHILEGVINKQSRSHLGCLVLDIFNAALSVSSSKDLLPQIGDLVSFVVTEVVVDGDILFMRGSLENIISPAKQLDSNQELHIPVSVKQEPRESSPEDIKPDASQDQEEEMPASASSIVFKSEPMSSSQDSSSPSKKKKKKKHKIKEEVQ